MFGFKDFLEIITKNEYNKREYNKLGDSKMENKNVEKKGVTSKVAAKVLSLKSVVHVVYLCQILALFFVVTAIVGVILNYLRLGKVKGTWLESHFRWQIKTFWVGLFLVITGMVVFVAGWASTATVSFIGISIIIVNIVWILYRVIKGWVALFAGREVAKKGVKSEVSYF